MVGVLKAAGFCCERRIYLFQKPWGPAQSMSSFNCYSILHSPPKKSQKNPKAGCHPGEYLLADLSLFQQCSLHLVQSQTRNQSTYFHLGFRCRLKPPQMSRAGAEVLPQEPCPCQRVLRCVPEQPWNNADLCLLVSCL